MTLVGLEKDAAGQVTTARVLADGREIEVRARTVVNATGVWADEVRTLDEGTDPDMIRPAKGIHITVPWRLVRNTIAVVVPVPKDRRSVFVVPWGDRGNGEFAFTYIGTTDTDYDGPLDDPQCTPADIEYLLRAINASVTTTITADDVLGTWAGLRPLVRAAASERTADLSRRHSVRVAPSGVVTVTGGKLTTYRRMAADAVDEITKLLDHDGRSRTKRRPPARHHGLGRVRSAACARGPVRRRRPRDPRACSAPMPRWANRSSPASTTSRPRSCTRCERRWRRTVDDVLSRRTRARLLARDASAAAADDVAALIGRRARMGRGRAARARPSSTVRSGPGRAGGGRAARDRARRAPPAAVVTPGLRPEDRPEDADGDEPRRAHSSHRVPRRRCRHRPPSARRASRSTTRSRSASLRPEPTSSRAGAVVDEASRDWWPLAMIWALDDQVAARAGAVVRPAEVAARRRDPARL